MSFIDDKIKECEFKGSCIVSIKKYQSDCVKCTYHNHIYLQNDKPKYSVFTTKK